MLQGHPQRAHVQSLSGPVIHRPADDPAGEQVQQDGVGFRGIEVSHQQVRCWRCRPVMLDGKALALPTFGFDTAFAPQPRDTMLTAGDASLIERAPGLHGAIGFTVFDMNSANLDQQVSICPDAATDRTIPPPVEPTLRYTQQRAQP